MQKFKTKSTRDILEPVTQQIGNLVLIGEYIDRGIQIPQLSENILKIVEATSNLVNVLKNIIERSTDEELKKKGNEYSSQITEHLTMLASSAKLFQESTKRAEASKLLIVGANGILNNVILVLSCYDDSQVRRIEQHLKEIKSHLKKPLLFQYEALVDLANGIKSNSVNAIQLLQPRVPEIISSSVASLIETLTLRLKELTTSFLSNLLEVEKNKDSESKSLLIEQACILKYKLYRVTVELLELIWLDELPNGVMDVFKGTLSSLSELCQSSLEDSRFNEAADTSGQKALNYLLKQIEQFVTENPETDKGIREQLSNMQSNMYKLLSSEKDAKTGEASANDIITQLDRLKSSFLLCYDEWVRERSKEARPIPTMMIDLSSCQTFDEWKMGVNAICHDCNSLTELYAESKSNEPIMLLLKNAQESIDSENIKDDYSQKGRKYQSINQDINQLSTLASQYICEKNLSELFNATRSAKKFSQAVDECHVSSEKNAKLLPRAQSLLEELEKDVQSLSRIALKTIHAYPIPLKSVFNIEDALDKTNNQRNFISFAFDQYKKVPKNAEIKSKIDEASKELEKSTHEISMEILPALDHEQVLRCLVKQSEEGRDLLQKGYEAKNSSHCLAGQEKIDFCLDILYKKNQSELLSCTDSEKQEELRAYAAELQKTRHTLLEKTTTLLDNGFNPSTYSEINNISTEAMSTLQDAINFYQFQQDEHALQTREEVLPAPETLVSVIVPEQYKEASAIIQNPQSDDRIAVAAAKLHQEIQPGFTGEDSFANTVVEISYMFANMSKIFKEPNSHSSMIQTAKNISERTQDLIKYAKKVYEACRDPRLKQLMASAIEKLPTISHQLKIMSTLRASRLKALGNAVTTETEESNQMLITCAENLTKGIQDTVKAIEAAKVRSKTSKIVSVSDV